MRHAGDGIECALPRARARKRPPPAAPRHCQIATAATQRPSYDDAPGPALARCAARRCRPISARPFRQGLRRPVRPPRQAQGSHGRQPQVVERGGRGGRDRRGGARRGSGAAPARPVSPRTRGPALSRSAEPPIRAPKRRQRAAPAATWYALRPDTPPPTPCAPPGANKGIGFEIARLLAAAGMRVVATSRDRERRTPRMHHAAQGQRRAAANAP